MLISNSDFSIFVHRFLDNKSYHDNYNWKFKKMSSIVPDEFIVEDM